MEIQIVQGNYAAGGYSYDTTKYSGPPDDHWMAVQENGKWQIVIHGNGFPKCSETEKFSIPLSVSGGCLDNNSNLIKP